MSAFKGIVLIKWHVFTAPHLFSSHVLSGSEATAVEESSDSPSTSILDCSKWKLYRNEADMGKDIYYV